MNRYNKLPHVLFDEPLEFSSGEVVDCDIEFYFEDSSIALGRVLLTGTEVEITEEEYDDNDYLYSIIQHFIRNLDDLHQEND